MSKEAISINSDYIQVYPAVKRNSKFYTSRLLTEDNYRRVLELPFYKYSGTHTYDTNKQASNHGSIIVSVSYSGTAVTSIEFTIRGYYFKVSNNTSENKLLKAINDALSAHTDKYVNVIIKQDIIGSDLNSFGELHCSDTQEEETLKFEGLELSDDPELGDYWKWGIQLVIPNSNSETQSSHHNVINPYLCLNSSDSKINSGDLSGSNAFYVDLDCPYFISGEEFAKKAANIEVLSKKLWIDNKYYIPHIWTHLLPSEEMTIEQIWKPLGAVYKTWE